MYMIQWNTQQYVVYFSEHIFNTYFYNCLKCHTEYIKAKFQEKCTSMCMADMQMLVAWKLSTNNSSELVSINNFTHTRPSTPFDPYIMV